MKTLIMNLFHQNIAHFLMINSGSLAPFGLNGKMALLYFFFSYSQKYNKQQYADFSFELMRQILSDTLQQIKENKDVDLNVLEVGWSLVRFVGNDFFKSNELDSIMKPFDDIVIDEAQRLPISSNFFKRHKNLLLVVLYLKDRLNYVNINSTQYPILKELLHLAFFDLVHSNQHKDDNLGVVLTLETLYNEAQGCALLGYLAKKGLKNINLQRKINNQLHRPAKKTDLSRVILISWYNSEMDFNDRLQQELRMEINKNMTSLYNEKNGEAIPTQISSIIFYIQTLLDWPQPKDVLLWNYIASGLLKK